MAIRKQRQRIRRAVQVIGILSFPATFFYFSPYVSMQGAASGVVSGSLLLFALLFVQAMVLGRLFCAWICPGGSAGDLLADSRPRRLRRARVHWIKYLVWAPWLLGIGLLFFSAGGIGSVQPFYGTVNGLSLSAVEHLIAYLMVCAVFVGLSLLVGRRASCHTICWMSPFMILGQKAGIGLRLPRLHLSAQSESCISCGACTRDCPMSLPVQELALGNRMEHSDCILCGNCVDACPKSVIHYGWGSVAPGAGT
jgi:polyferredoxin